ncbi:uncharacterized protein [Prorops nasuta]|uniref:uncharacterized protein n=1 Tax=Prorops nasuta TaxID=863751 RepID=UPI0034CF8EFB
MEDTLNNPECQILKDSKTRSNSSFIEWNVDMKVTVSNARKSKIFQRTRSAFIFILAILFVILVYHFKREIRTLQAQMHCMNTSLIVLMSKYDRLNRNMNRAQIKMPRMMQYDKVNVQAVETSLLEESTVKNDFDLQTLLPETRIDDKPLDVQVNSKKSDDELTTDSEIRNRTSENLNNNIIDDEGGERERVGERNEGQRAVRIERAILAIGKRNGTDRSVDRVIIMPSNRSVDSDIRRKQSDSFGDGDLSSSREMRSGRWKRDDGRGKKRRKNRKRPNARSRRRLGPLVATFVGAIPEQHVTDAVYIGPWVRSASNDSQYAFNKFHLVDDKKSIEVTTGGLYLISVQIFYFGEPSNYSYWIMLSSEGSSTTQNLVKCATASTLSVNEVSCHTSIVTPLRRGDRVHIQQQERNRLINMREGHSHVQIVLLTGNLHKKRFQ